MAPRLSVEYEVYENNKSEWVQSHRGQFVVVKGNALLGFFVTFHEAYFAAVEKYGTNVDFLVKRVVLQEPVFEVL